MPHPLGTATILYIDMKKPNIILIGLGLHAKRIYMQFLANSNNIPKVIVDLESKKKEINAYIVENKWDINIYCVPDKSCNDRELSGVTKKDLLRLIKKYKINKAIISTEPKGHYSYGNFFLSNGVDILIDKPITAPVNVSTDSRSAKQIYLDYKLLTNYALTVPSARCVIQSQRRFHPGYRYIKNILRNYITKYRVPITHIDIYHCDGLWSMPNEYAERENHPYKYGYGKLMHSGYHFIDLFTWLVELNWLISDKSPNNLELFTQTCNPNDCIFQINKENYSKFFGEKVADGMFKKYSEEKYEYFGEVDSYTQLQLRRDKKVVTTASINLLQNGFSRRSWTELPIDTYKSNGRIRHEYVNIQMGPLLNIQVHSYESYEIKDRGAINVESDVGGLEHFDIFIFRNSRLVGGKYFERKKIDIKHGANHIGHNEDARNECLLDFLSDTKDGCSDIAYHNFTNMLLSQIYQATCKKKKGLLPHIAISIKRPEFYKI